MTLYDLIAFTIFTLFVFIPILVGLAYYLYRDYTDTKNRKDSLIKHIASIENDLTNISYVANRHEEVLAKINDYLKD